MIGHHDKEIPCVFDTSDDSTMAFAIGETIICPTLKETINTKCTIAICPLFSIGYCLRNRENDTNHP